MKINTTQHTVKNLILDLGVVLIDLTPDKCLERFREYGVKEIDRFLDPSYKYGLFLEFEAGKISSRQFRDRLRELSEIPLTDDQIDFAWTGFLGEIPDYKLELLEELKQYFNLFLLSNTNAIHWEWVEKTYQDCSKHSFGEYFKKAYLSYELQMIKPDRRIFEYVLDDAALKPEETFFIDDALENCCVARELGIYTYTPQPGENWEHLFNR